jgi:hypothetical protein
MKLYISVKSLIFNYIVKVVSLFIELTSICVCIELSRVGLINALSFLSMTGGTFYLDEILYKKSVSWYYRLSVFNLGLGNAFKNNLQMQ